MKKKDYVKPNAQVLSLYTDEFMESGFHTGSTMKGSLDAGFDGGDADSSNSNGIDNDQEP